MVLLFLGECGECGMTGKVKNPFTFTDTLKCQACPRSPTDKQVSLLEPVFGTVSTIVSNIDIHQKLLMARIAEKNGLRFMCASLNNKGSVVPSTLKEVDMNEVSELGRPCGHCYSAGRRMGFLSSTLKSFGPCQCRRNPNMNTHTRELWLQRRKDFLNDEKTRQEKQSKLVRLAKVSQKEARMNEIKKRRGGTVKSYKKTGI